MIHFLLIFLLSLAPHEAFANSRKSLKQGDQLANEFLGRFKQEEEKAKKNKSRKTKDVPQYQGVSKEANLKADHLEGSSKSLIRHDSASQMVHESYDSRPQVKIDVNHDPLLTRADKIQEDPLRAIGGKGTQLTQVQQGGTNEHITCEEAGEKSLETCVNTLIVKVKKTKVRKEWKGQFHFWRAYEAEKNGFYLACGALRHDVFTARRRGSGNITASYRACLQEIETEEQRRLKLNYRRAKLNANKEYIRIGSVQLPRLNIQPSQIKEVTLDQRPSPKILKRRGKPVNPGYYLHCHFIYHKHEDEYQCQPSIKIVYEEDSYEVLPDEEVSTCDALEKRADLGLCSYVSKVCTQGRQTRDIDGIPITRECWQDTFTYECSYPAKNDCGPLRARGCGIIDSQCKQRIGNKCVVYSQTYECKDAPRTSYRIMGGKTPFCLDGHCRDQGWEKNNEMMSSLAQLAILKEMQGLFALKEGFFKGEDLRCSKYIFSFKDCCGSENGWGPSVGFKGCGGHAKKLSLKRKAGLCHFVGTYCDKKERITGKCLKKKSSYCCFGSKLLKAFHEQGRAQIGMGWGEPKEPLCRGYTIEEIQRIDFSKLDLKEVFEDLMKDYKPGKQGGTGKHIGERMETIKKGVLPPTQKQPKQRPEA